MDSSQLIGIRGRERYRRKEEYDSSGRLTLYNGLPMRLVCNAAPWFFAIGKRMELNFVNGSTQHLEGFN